MFYPGSRYEKTGTYQVTAADGTTLTVTKLPLPPAPESVRLLGFHPRQDDQRLDHIANHYLADATGFWRLCDANGTVVPDALGTRSLVGIPRQVA
jgi:hypothetical protein